MLKDACLLQPPRSAALSAVPLIAATGTATASAPERLQCVRDREYECRPPIASAAVLSARRAEGQHRVTGRCTLTRSQSRRATGRIDMPGSGPPGSSLGPASSRRWTQTALGHGSGLVPRALTTANTPTRTCALSHDWRCHPIPPCSWPTMSSHRDWAVRHASHAWLCQRTPSAWNLRWNWPARSRHISQAGGE